MAYTPDRLFVGLVSSTALTTVYTVPGSGVQKVILKQLVCANVGTVAAKLRLSINAGTSYLVYDYLINPPSALPLVIDLSQVLRPNDTFTASSDTANALSLSLSGIVYS